MKNIFKCFVFLSLMLLMACKSKTDNRIAIAILTPVSHPSLEQIEKGFKQRIEELAPNQFRFDTYNAQGNKMLMRSELEEILQRDYQLILTIGTSATQMTKEVVDKKRNRVPIVFTAVNDPLGFHIVTSEEHPGDNITGVKEMLHFNEELKALLDYHPDIKNILLVYNPREPGLHKNQKEIAFLLDQEDIKLKTVEVFQTNELFAKVSPFIGHTDALLVLKDNTVVSGLDILVKLCDTHEIPLMASDLDSPDRGAAFGYGVYEIDFGIEAAHIASRILIDHEVPGEIPITSVRNFTLRINEKAAQKQGGIKS